MVFHGMQPLPNHLVIWLTPTPFRHHTRKLPTLCSYILEGHHTHNCLLQYSPPSLLSQGHGIIQAAIFKLGGFHQVSFSKSAWAFQFKNLALKNRGYIFHSPKLRLFKVLESLQALKEGGMNQLAKKQKKTESIQRKIQRMTS